MKTKAINKPKMNYIVDLVIAVGFVLVAVSGVVMLFAGSGGFQGGRNPQFQQAVLGLSRWTWKAIHDWSAVVMGGGVLIHLVLHWKWIGCMTRSLLKRDAGHRATARSAATQCRPYEA